MSNRRPSINPDAFPQSGSVAQSLPPAVRLLRTAEQDQVFFRFDLKRALYLHRWLAAGILAVSLALAIAYVIVSGPRYTAESLVYIQPAPPRMMETAPTQHWPYDANTYESYIQQQIHNVTRPDVLEDAVRKLPAGAWRQAQESEQGAADRLGRAVVVARVGTGYQVSITARAHTPELAAQISNALATAFVESAARELRSGDSQRISILTEERDRVMKELATDRAEQEQLNRKLGVASIGTAAVDPYDEQANQLRSDLVRAREANDEAAARLTSMGTADASTATALDAQADDLASSDPGLVSMKTSLNSRRATLISQMANLTPNHPQYKQDAEELAQINASLDNMAKDLRTKAAQRIEQKLRSDLERTAGLEARLNAQLAQLTGAAGGATSRLQRANDLATDIQRLQNRYAVVDEQLRNLTMENDAPGADYLSAAAMPPLHSTEAVILRNAMVLVLGGLLTAVFASLVAYNLDQRVYIANDVERVLGFSPMAQLPDFSRVSEGVAEEYLLRLAAAIDHAHQQAAVRSYIFTGITAGAGTTTVISRVRSILEAMGRSTMLIHSSSTHGGEHAPHADGATSTELATRGRRPTALLQKMANDNRTDTLVLTDTAPLMVSGETEYLARFVDAAIVIIESGATTRAQLRQVAQTLQHLEVSAVGFVLNRIAADKASPDFRESIKAVERHVESQNLTHARRAARNTVKSRPEPQTQEVSSESPKAELAQPAEPVATESTESTKPLPSPAQIQPEVAEGAVAPEDNQPAVPIVEVAHVNGQATPVAEPEPAVEIAPQVMATPEILSPRPLSPRPLRTLSSKSRDSFRHRRHHTITQEMPKIPPAPDSIPEELRPEWQKPEPPVEETAAHFVEEPVNSVSKEPVAPEEPIVSVDVPVTVPDPVFHLDAEPALNFVESALREEELVPAAIEPVHPEHAQAEAAQPVLEEIIPNEPIPTDIAETPKPVADNPAADRARNVWNSFLEGFPIRNQWQEPAPEITPSVEVARMDAPVEEPLQLEHEIVHFGHHTDDLNDVPLQTFEPSSFEPLVEEPELAQAPEPVEAHDGFSDQSLAVPQPELSQPQPLQEPEPIQEPVHFEPAAAVFEPAQIEEPAQVEEPIFVQRFETVVSAAPIPEPIFIQRFESAATPVEAVASASSATETQRNEAEVNKIAELVPVDASEPRQLPHPAERLLRVAPRRTTPQRVYTIPQPGQKRQVAPATPSQAPVAEIASEPVGANFQQFSWQPFTAESKQTSDIASEPQVADLPAPKTEGFAPKAELCANPILDFPAPVTELDESMEAPERPASKFDSFRWKPETVASKPFSAPSPEPEAVGSSPVAVEPVAPLRSSLVSGEGTDTEAVATAASRLGGLRNLIDSLGLSNLNKIGNHGQEPEFDITNFQSAAAPQNEKPSSKVRQEEGSPISDFPTQSAHQDAAPQTSLPIPPQSVRHDRWIESTDDIETLPGWRSQLGKR